MRIQYNNPYVITIPYASQLPQGTMSQALRMSQVNIGIPQQPQAVGSSRSTATTNVPQQIRSKYSKRDFEQYLKGDKSRLVVAYWNQCPHCQPIKDLVSRGVDLRSKGILAVEADNISDIDYGFPQVFYAGPNGAMIADTPGTLDKVLSRIK